MNNNKILFKIIICITFILAIAFTLAIMNYFNYLKLIMKVDKIYIEQQYLNQNNNLLDI